MVDRLGHFERLHLSVDRKDFSTVMDLKENVSGLSFFAFRDSAQGFRDICFSKTDLVQLAGCSRLEYLK